MCLDCATLRNQLSHLETELAGAIEGYEIESSNRRKAEREAHRLKRELNGSTTKESQQVMEVCEHHAELWVRTFPKARGLSYPMDGKNAAAVRKVIRWGKPVTEIKRVLDGAFASDFHRTKRTYLTLESILRDENRIREHLERADEVALEAFRVEREDRENRLWPPVDRVIFELRRLGIEARKADGTRLDARRVWLYTADCPLCRKAFHVGETFETHFASVECAGGCDFFRVLDSLRLWPTDLLAPSDPEVEYVPLQVEVGVIDRGAKAPVSKRHDPNLSLLPPLGSPVLFELAA